LITLLDARLRLMLPVEFEFEDATCEWQCLTE